MKATHFAHRWQDTALDADVAEDFPDHVAEKKEVNSGWDCSEEYESHLEGLKIKKNFYKLDIIWEISQNLSQKLKNFTKLGWQSIKLVKFTKIPWNLAKIW